MQRGTRSKSNIHCGLAMQSVQQNEYISNWKRFKQIQQRYTLTRCKQKVVSRLVAAHCAKVQTDANEEHTLSIGYWDIDPMGVVFSGNQHEAQTQGFSHGGPTVGESSKSTETLQPGVGGQLDRNPLKQTTVRSILSLIKQYDIMIITGFVSQQMLDEIKQIDHVTVQLLSAASQPTTHPQPPNQPPTITLIQSHNQSKVSTEVGPKFIEVEIEPIELSNDQAAQSHADGTVRALQQTSAPHVWFRLPRQVLPLGHDIYVCIVHMPRAGQPLVSTSSGEQSLGASQASGRVAINSEQRRDQVSGPGTARDVHVQDDVAMGSSVGSQGGGVQFGSHSGGQHVQYTAYYEQLFKECKRVRVRGGVPLLLGSFGADIGQAQPVLQSRSAMQELRLTYDVAESALYRWCTASSGMSLMGSVLARCIEHAHMVVLNGMLTWLQSDAVTHVTATSQNVFDYVIADVQLLKHVSHVQVRDDMSWLVSRHRPLAVTLSCQANELLEFDKDVLKQSQQAQSPSVNSFVDTSQQQSDASMPVYNQNTLFHDDVAFIPIQNFSTPVSTHNNSGSGTTSANDQYARPVEHSPSSGSPTPTSTTTGTARGIRGGFNNTVTGTGTSQPTDSDTRAPSVALISTNTTDSAHDLQYSQTKRVDSSGTLGGSGSLGSQVSAQSMDSEEQWEVFDQYTTCIKHGLHPVTARHVTRTILKTNNLTTLQQPRLLAERLQCLQEIRGAVGGLDLDRTLLHYTSNILSCAPETLKNQCVKYIYSPPIVDLSNANAPPGNSRAPAEPSKQLPTVSNAELIAQYPLLLLVPVETARSRYNALQVLLQEELHMSLRLTNRLTHVLALLRRHPLSRSTAQFLVDELSLPDAQRVVQREPSVLYTKVEVVRSRFYLLKRHYGEAEAKIIACAWGSLLMRRLEGVDHGQLVTRLADLVGRDAAFAREMVTRCPLIIMGKLEVLQVKWQLLQLIANKRRVWEQEVQEWQPVQAGRALLAGHKALERAERVANSNYGLNISLLRLVTISAALYEKRFPKV